MVDSADTASTITVIPLAPLTALDAERCIEAIIHHPSPPPVSANGSSISSDPSWTIRNKYYTADVAFRIDDGSSYAGEEPAVIVLAARTSRPHADLTSRLRVLARRQPEIDVAVLVSVDPSDCAAESQAALDEEAWDDAALDCGFEWVDWSSRPATRTVVEAAGDEPAMSGIARVVAALHAHMWEDMVPVEDRRTTPSALGSTRPNEDEDDTDDAEDLSHLPPPSLPSPKPHVPLPVAFPDTFLPSLRARPRAAEANQSEANGFTDDFAPFEQGLSPSHTSFPPLDTRPTIASSPASTAQCRHAELSFPDSLHLDEHAGELEHDDEDLDKMFEQLSAVKVDMEGLGLDERRERAEKAMRSLGLLGGGGREGEESE